MHDARVTAIVDVDPALAQRRTVRTLVLTQATGAMGITIGIATASLLAKELSGSETLAGLAQTAQVLGTAMAALVLARLMTRRGRRAGLVAGYLAGAAGAGLAVISGVLGSMTVLLLGALLLGATTAANQASRYAATDLAVPERRARALSVVVWATTIGAVLGPNLTGPSGALAHDLGLSELTGPFLLGAVAMLVTAVLAAALLRPDPLLLARELADRDRRTPPEPVRGTSWSRARQVVRDSPVVLLAVVALSGAHASMVAVMVMTPLHMEHGGAALEIIGFVISIHVLGMFAFSPVVGWAADRWGRGQVVVAGGAVLLAATGLSAISPEGHSPVIVVGLFLLGVGWSMVTVAASTVLADEVPIEARADVQGLADMTMSLSAAVGGGVAGFVVGAAGFPTLSGLAAILGAVVVAAGVYVARHTRVSLP